MDRPVDKPDAVISIDGNILATRGNIMTVTGQAKAGKSGLLAAILAGVMVLPGDVVDLLGLTVQRNEHGRAVIHIDGEQSLYDHYRGMCRIVGRVSRKKEPEWFHSYNFRLLDIPNRLANLKTLCALLSEAHDGIHLIVLDGGADFVLDPNDLQESKEVVRLFESLAIEFDCPVVTVVHFNPGSDKVMGHFGSQLGRKSETVISVTKDKDSEISTVEGKFLRNSGNIPNLQFCYDLEQGCHVYHGVRIKENREDRDEKKNDKLKQLAIDVFSGQKKGLTYTSACSAIEIILDMSEATAKNRVRDMQKKGFIIKGDDDLYSLNHGIITEV